MFYCNILLLALYTWIVHVSFKFQSKESKAMEEDEEEKKPKEHKKKRKGSKKRSHRDPSKEEGKVCYWSAFVLEAIGITGFKSC